MRPPFSQQERRSVRTRLIVAVVAVVAAARLLAASVPGVAGGAAARAVADTDREAASLLSARGGRVGSTNMQYIDPPEAYPVPPGVNGISEIWWEAYGPDAPPPN